MSPHGYDMALAFTYIVRPFQPSVNNDIDIRFIHIYRIMLKNPFITLSRTVVGRIIQLQLNRINSVVMHAHMANDEGRFSQQIY